ncbi:unnamed protein product [Ascophyllum nodosum]
MKVLSLSRTSFLALLVDTVLSTIAATVWLTEDGVPRCAPLPSSNLVPFGRCGGTREAGNTDAESLVVLYRVGTHQIQRRRRAARSSASQGRAESLCTRIKVVTMIPNWNGESKERLGTRILQQQTRETT